MDSTVTKTRLSSKTVSVLDSALAKNIPVFVMLEITYRCNLKCCHCYLPINQEQKEMSTDQIKDVLDQLAAAGCLLLTISGGEILTRGDLFEIANYALERNFALRLFTNGTLIDTQAADMIEKLHPFSIEISIYGADKSTHDGVTGIDGSFVRSVNAIKLLRKRGINTILKCTLLKQNIGQYREIISLAEELGVAYQFNPCVLPKLDGSPEPLTHRLGEADLKQIFSDRVLNPDSTERHEKSETQLAEESEAVMCNAGRGACVISPEGEVYPCAALRISFGNLKERSFLEIWRSSENALRLRALRFSDLPACSKCRLSEYCDRCPGMALLEDGDLRNPANFFCQIARIRKSIAEESGKGGE